MAANARRGAAFQRSAGVARIYSLRVEGVAGLVHGAEEGGREPATIEAGGDTHVVLTGAYAERVDGPVLPPALPIIAEGRDHLSPEPLLGCLVECSSDGRCPVFAILVS